jgi:hypothetical protein
MTTTRKVVGKLLPALESRPSLPGVGDITSVPAVNVLVETGGRSVSCVGIIDTGADLSLLDESIFLRLGDPPSGIRTETSMVSLLGEQATLYPLNLRMQGETADQEIAFGGVPVAVAKLHRPVLLLGRRGVLERLRIDIDFPRGAVTMVLSQRLAATYPTLSTRLSGFERAVDLLESGSIVEGVLVLALEVERLADRMMALGGQAATDTGKELRRAGLKDKLLALCGEADSDLVADVTTLVMQRNAAAHSPSDPMRELSSELVLGAAERVVSRLPQPPLEGGEEGLLRGVNEWVRQLSERIASHGQWRALWSQRRPADEATIGSQVCRDLAEYVRPRGGDVSWPADPGGFSDCLVHRGSSRAVIELKTSYGDWRQGIRAEIASCMSQVRSRHGLFLLMAFNSAFKPGSDELRKLLHYRDSVCKANAVRIDVAVVDCDKPEAASRRRAAPRGVERVQHYPAADLGAEPEG